MNELAAGGYWRGDVEVLPPETCEEITRHLLTVCREVGYPADLRQLFNSYKDYLLWESRHAVCDWHDLVASRVREVAASFTHEPEPLSTEEKKAQARQIIREILKQTDNVGEQVEEYRKRTKRSRADFFRHKREVESREFDSEAPSSGI